MAPPTFDLQSHSVHSDGALPVAEVVARAAAAGVELLALTDHDTVDGVAEAAVAARRHGIALLPAAELSAVHGGHEDLHVLGYGLNVEDAVLRDRLAGARADREVRAEGMAARLRELGWEVDDAPLAARRAAGKPIGRPHLAAAVLGYPANAERLRDEGVAEADAFFPAYLVPGARAYLPRTRPTVAEAIGWIHDAGGVAVWAHPFWDLDEPEAVLAIARDLVSRGLDGVEAFYATHDRGQTLLLARFAAEHHGLATGSADFHGPEHPRFHSFRAFELFGAEPRLPAT